MDGDCPPPYGDSPKSKSERLFYVAGRHSRNSSMNSIVGDGAEEDSVELLPSVRGGQSKPSKEAENYSKGNEQSKGPCKVTGSCLCKLSVGFYLATCILISALYVAFYGKSQALFGDAWIPGKPTVHDKPTPEPRHYFEDLPYTEWISQRWTYHDSELATDWPSLPEEVDQIRQLVFGKVGGVGGLWVLTETQLFFATGMFDTGQKGARFENVSQQLELEVSPDTYIIRRWDTHLYLVSAFNLTYLDCTQKDCEVSIVTCDLLPFDTVLSSCYSLSDDTLWLGTSQGLFTVYYDQEADCLGFNNISDIIGPVQTLAWRSTVTDDPQSRHPNMRPLFFRASVVNSLQAVFASSSGGAMQGSSEFWQQRNNGEMLFGLLVVGTADKVYFFDGKLWWFEWVSSQSTGLEGLMDGAPTAMTFVPSGELYIASNASLMRVNINYTFDYIGALDGLPYNQLTSLHHSNYSPVYPPLVGPAPPASKHGTLWIGTSKGYTLFDIRSSKFIGYYNGPRWLPGGSVVSMVGSGSRVAVLTEEGVAVVHPEHWTLTRKAKHYHAMLYRHIREPGLVSDCPLTNHTPSTCVPSTSDNDGLWTSWMVAAEAFRFRVTGDRTAKENAWELFSGMKFLVNVTDIEGLMASTVASENSTVGMEGGEGEDWHDSINIPGWRWKGDANSAQVVGHMWAYPLVLDLVATEEEQRQQVQDVVNQVTEYIKSNQYLLLDVGNTSTRWGVWSPAQLNLNQSWAGERGPNSLQILSYLLSAYRITSDEQFLQGFKELFSGLFEEVPTYYGLNMINQKITSPMEDASEDELSFLPYFLYYYSLQRMDKEQQEAVGEAAQHFADLSIRRAWRSVRRSKSSVWTTIFAYVTGGMHRSCLQEQLVWTLRNWPLELIEWETTNSHRLDIRFNPEQDRRKVESMQVLPANERPQLRWSGNPFLLDRPGSSSEVDPGPWLLPYWMARWGGML